MKKLLWLFILTLFVSVSNSYAQPPGGGNPEAMMKRMKEVVKPRLIEKTGISDAEADRVLEIQMAFQQKQRALRQDQSLSDDDRKAKIQELNKERNQQLKAIPLSEEKVKAVNDFYEEMRQQQQRNRDAGNQ